jgi:hypothetical protein
MDGQKVFSILFLIIVIGYFFMYFTGRQYLRGEGFQGSAGSASKTADELYPTPPLNERPPLPAFVDPVARKREESRVLMERTDLDPVENKPIDSVDDYEYSLVFQNESDRELSKALRTKLMSQRPMDWAGLPPSSAEFQAGVRESFANATPAVPENAQPFRNIDGSNMVPPDTTSIEMEERKLLQTYKPPRAKDMLKYDPELQSPEELIQEIYNVRGLVPTVAHKEGTNVYEVIGVRRKDEKILYEDEEAPAGAGGAAVDVPQVTADVAASMDPYYDKTGASMGQGSRMGRWNYQAWTPGLERMYAPTEATPSWF